MPGTDLGTWDMVEKCHVTVQHGDLVNLRDQRGPEAARFKIRPVRSGERRLGVRKWRECSR